MAQTDEWTEEKCIHLIREFRAKSILWDPKDPFFFKKTLKPAAWEEIAQTINVPAEDCKHKMSILMSSFRREKSKILNSLKNSEDSSNIYNSSWFAFKELAFLLDKKSERKRRLEGTESDNDDDEDDECSSSVKKALLKYHIQRPISNTITRTPTTTRKRSEHVSAQAIREERISVPLQSDPGPSQTPEERDEEIKSFINFIGNKMKRYSNVTKNAVQQEICDIIFKADRNEFENTKFTIIDADSDPLDKSLGYAAHEGVTIKMQSYSDNSD